MNDTPAQMTYVPFRYLILKQLQALVEQCYCGDESLKGRVHIGRMDYGSETQSPFVAFIEPPLDFSTFKVKPFSQAATYDWHVLVQGFTSGIASNGDKTSKDCYAFLADVRKLLYATRIGKNNQVNILNLGGIQGSLNEGQSNLILDLQIGAGVIRPDERVPDRCNFWLELSFQLAESVKEPFVKILPLT